MADVQPLRAYRYDLARVGNLSAVVAPPYDVISTDLQQQLYQRSPHNVIRLDLTKDEPGDTPNNNRYTRSARTLRDWQVDGILQQDTARALYAYEQTFTVEGKTYTRRGVLARVRLEPFGTGRIFPHEETLAGPKADRLALYRATGMNLSPVFGLYPDPDGAVYAHLAGHTAKHLPVEATDHLGTVSRLWPITDQHLISAVSGALGPKPVFIADGHHRYETGLRYLAEQEELGLASTPDAPARYILMMLVGMSDPGLIILPTHRLVSGLPGLTAEALTAKLAPCFAIERIGVGPAAAQQCWEHVEMDGGQDLLGLGTAVDQTWLTAKLTAPARMDELAAEHSPTWRGLGVSILHRLVLGQLLAGETKCQYVHLLAEVQDALAGRQCDVAVLVPPAEMGHVETIAGNWEKMPPKSTYFYPKLLTGLVFNSLKSH
jgi:uncharacterized protein (DUF1015 family)